MEKRANLRGELSMRGEKRCDGLSGAIEKRIRKNQRVPNSAMRILERFLEED